MVAKARNQPTRPRHVPQRSCVVCRQVNAKRALIRLVRTVDGRVAIDLSGKQPGRGAYLCHNPECWTNALRRHALERALKIATLHPDDRAMIEQMMRQLFQASEPTALAAAGSNEN
ncbi:MAG: YlxR family protein [Chloroflexus sp.]